MGFYEILFPVDISYGSRGGPGFNTSIIRTDSGGEERVARWSTPIHQYDVSYGVKSHQALYDVKEFYWSVLGSADGFRYKDWGDYATTPKGQADERTSETVTNADVLIGTGDGTVVDFQLVKLYKNAFITRTRVITKPVAGTVLVAVDGVSKTETTDFSVNTATGVVTFVVAPPLDKDVTVGFEFDVPARFGEEADATLQATISSFGHGDIGSIPVEEIINGIVVPEQYFFGGAFDHGDSAVDITMSLSQGFLHIVKPTVISLKARMPRADDIATGGIILAVVNDGSQTIDVTDTDGVTTILSLAVNAIGEFLLSVSSSGVKTYLGK